jgi:tRNA dimethylallyltransferase
MPANLPIPVIIGPTASGKSSLGVELALAAPARLGLRAEIVTADAFQVYRALDVGTAKPTLSERRGVPHHLVDVREPTESFSVDQWLDLGEAAVADIRSRGALPVLVGGTHLYVKAFLHGLFDGPPADPALRAALAGMDPGARRAELERVDPGAAARIHPNDERRTVRALEVHRLTGTPISAHQSQWGAPDAARRDTLVVALSWPVDALNRRINARVKRMFDAGLVDEVRSLLATERLGPGAREALGYKQLAAAFERTGGNPSASDLDEAFEQIKIQTRRFAKNQRTWLKRLGALPGALTLDMSTLAIEQAADRIFERLLRREN